LTTQREDSGRVAITYMDEPSIRPPTVGEIQVWTIPLDAANPPARRAQAHAAERRILAGYLGISGDELSFVKHPAGKPALAGGELEFNLTHSGAWAMIAVSLDIPVGIDLERPRSFASPERFERVVQRICSPAEQVAVAAAADPTAFLLRLWVRKEALVKASGDGVGAGERLPDLDVLADRSGNYTVTDLTPPATTYHAALAQTGSSSQVVYR
jgi:4'-phosphopantetheinyl transferase